MVGIFVWRFQVAELWCEIAEYTCFFAEFRMEGWWFSRSSSQNSDFFDTIKKMHPNESNNRKNSLDKRNKSQKIY
ncbi:hypothetical protein DYI25_00195 [Mesobacillus boroniphilus]|uniref:Uncharacterized protein n=1 Tax=Mesobacillus boroniphilus TaxID=308892 RepID=A0A944CHN5_9BACI|nr:hypothetical protein [Mesobacillus boroniphilus]